MLKYLNTQVTFAEVPDEITLCINLTGCRIGCKGCHSPYLAEDIGHWLTHAQIDANIAVNEGISCVCLMGGDSEPDQINLWAEYIKKKYGLRVAWYSGRQELSEKIDLWNFDYIKLGPYNEELGPLNKRTTNQRFYEVFHFSNGRSELIDRTYKFWKHEIED